jgi:predicted nucleic-acid-binding Zn-ribbon protein
VRSGVCPKCGSQEIHGSRGNFSWGAEQGVRIKTSPLVRGTMVDTFICADCGYFEHYVADSEKLSEVAQAWPRITLSS